MRSTEKNVLRAWVAHWGFAILVGLAMVVATYVAWKVKVPPEVPAFALNAAAIYRVEVGAATFLGVHGLKAQDIAKETQRDVIQEHEESLEVLWSAVEMLEGSTGKSGKRNVLSS